MPENIYEQLDEALGRMLAQPTFESASNVINRVIALLGISANTSNWKLFSDSNGKIASNAGWFHTANGYADRRATYTIAADSEHPIDLKAYWMHKMDKSKLSWAVALTPNFEDYPMDLGDNMGIDFFISDDCASVVVVLSKNFVLRTLELKGHLSNTQKEIFAVWDQQFDFANIGQVHDVLWKSFDFEPVNRQFFKGISTFFSELKQHLSGVGGVFDEREAAFYANRLIGRLIFVWFLDKKGIIAQKQEYFRVGEESSNAYYSQKLSQLYFEVLNTEVKDRSVADLETPYLNGGLFEKRKDDEKISKSEKAFPVDYFQRFYTFLHHYNFTTDESSSDFQQSAIDPEMLGRIFENLLAEQNEATGESARKAKGAFYTPRDVVDYMCKETLLQYLKSCVEIESEHMHYLETLVMTKDHDWRDQQRNYRDRLKSSKAEIIQALDAFTVLDPACGSGAFPMGMMQLLVQTYERIESRFDAKRVKKNVIKNNLFGLDIEPMAIEIARLRAWLSIIVDEDNDSRDIKPLPNLDFKFVTANSLITLEDKQEESLFDRHELAANMLELRQGYFDSGNKRTKAKLRKDFTALTNNGGQLSLNASKREQQLLSYDPFNIDTVAEFFDPVFMFSIESFHAVIGNPPYVSIWKIPESDKGIYADTYTTAKGHYDLYVLFFERALALAGDAGIVSFITSNKWMSQSYGKSLRELFLTKKIIKLLDFSSHQVFESATVDTQITIIQNKDSDGFVDVYYNMDEVKPDMMNLEFNKYATDLFNIHSDKNFKLNLSKLDVEIIDKIHQKSVKLKDILYISKGAELHSTKEKIKKEVYIFKNYSDGLVPYTEGKCINRFVIQKELFLDYTPSKHKAPCFPELFESEKLIVKNVIGRGGIVATYDNKGHYTNDALINAVPYWKLQNLEYTQLSRYKESNLVIRSRKFSLQFILGILNSKLETFYFTKLLANGLHFYPRHLKDMPIPDSENHAITKLVHEIIEAKRFNAEVSTIEIEEKIDEIIMDYYQLTHEHKKYVRGLT